MRSKINRFHVFLCSGFLLAIFVIIALAFAAPRDAFCQESRGQWELVQRDSFGTDFDYFPMCCAVCDSLDITFSFTVLDYKYGAYLVGSAFRASITGEGALGGDYYYLKMASANNANVLQLRIAKAGADSLLSSYLMEYIPAGTQYKMRVWARGADLRGKAWMPVDPEPSLWQVQATDSTFSNGDIAFLTCHTAAKFFYIELAPPGSVSVEPQPYARVVTLGKAEVLQNVPNPFNPETRIDFSLVEAGVATLRVYDAQGRAIRTLMNELRPKGRYSVHWDGRDDSGNRMASGVYFYELTIGGDRSSRKMILLK